MTMKAITLEGLPSKQISLGKACTPVKRFSPVLDAFVVVCAEGEGEDLVTTKRKRGRPKGSKSSRKGGSAAYPEVPSCPIENRSLVDVVVKGRNRGKRCVCRMPGRNARFLKREACPEWNANNK